MPDSPNLPYDPVQDQEGADYYCQKKIERHLRCTGRRRERPEVQFDRARHVGKHLRCTARRRERPKVQSNHASHVRRQHQKQAQDKRKDRGTANPRMMMGIANRPRSEQTVSEMLTRIVGAELGAILPIQRSNKAEARPD